MTSSPIQYTPPASPLSPTASFYDVSDEEEGEYNTIAHTPSGRGVKLLFSKSKVYVHPTPSAKDNIAGFVALIQQRALGPTDYVASPSSGSKSSADALLLAWVPESSLGDAYSTYVKVDLSDGSSPPKQSHLVPRPPVITAHSSAVGSYAFAVPLSQVFSLLVRPPSIGWWYGSVVINTRTGDSFPPLFFHDDECHSTILQRKKHLRESFDPFGGQEGGMYWGGDEVLRWMRRYITVERSAAEPSVYLIEPTEEDRQGFGHVETTKAVPASGAGPASPPAKRDASMDPLTKALKEARWSFLEKLSQVTNFTRRTANEVFDNPKMPPQVRRLMKNPEVQTLQDEFDSARIYLARWALGVAEQSERERNRRIWTAKDVLEMEDTTVGAFEILDMEAANLSVRERRKPVTLAEWKGYFDATTGTLQVRPDEVKERIFHGGLDPEDGVRKEAWLFLLGVYDWESSTESRKAIIADRRDEYIRLKGAWWDKVAEGGGNGDEGEWWREQKSRIEKDVHRTDRTVPLFAGEDIPHPDPDSPFSDVGTNVHLEQMKDLLLTYNEYNRDLGYVQGMSDLLAPIYAIMQDDAVAFWGFVGFMHRMERNFLRDQSGMRSQLLTLDHLVQLLDPALYLHLQSADSTNFFFFFRMLLVWYKREFDYPDVLRLWEGLWTDYLSSQFHLFIALAILERHRTVIMEHLKHFDEVLKYVNELSTTIDLQQTLIRAEALFRRFQRTVEAIDKSQNFPAPSVRPRLPSSPPSSSSPPALPPPVKRTTSQSPSSSSSTRASPQSQTHARNDSAGVKRQGNTTTATTATTARTGNSPPGRGKEGKRERDGEVERGGEKVISPELRQLLSRKILGVYPRPLSPGPAPALATATATATARATTPSRPLLSHASSSRRRPPSSSPPSRK